MSKASAVGDHPFCLRMGGNPTFTARDAVTELQAHLEHPVMCGVAEEVAIIRMAAMLAQLAADLKQARATQGSEPLKLPYWELRTVQTLLGLVPGEDEHQIKQTLRALERYTELLLYIVVNLSHISPRDVYVDTIMCGIEFLTPWTTVCLTDPPQLPVSVPA